MPLLSDAQLERYSRNVILPEIGAEGQARLLAAKVLILGLGGLGSPVAYYLAANGIGTLGLADDDGVEPSNLQRQILHSTLDLGRPKTESACEKILALNPEVKVKLHAERIQAKNIRSVMEPYDLVVDGSDNFSTRFLVNDACILANKPLSHGAVLGWEGQLTTILPGETPCYRCLFKEPPPPGTVPSCHSAGILGVVPGIIGALQATEVIKYFLGVGQLLAGKLLVVDAKAMTFREVTIPRNPDCPVCGAAPRIHELVESEYWCGK